MAADKSKSLIMAQRLKDLRTERGLSHESLRRALMEKYGIDISVDSLKNYEVSKVPHAKAYKNEGMRVEYLRCLADFYGVSSDYLLGADVPKSPNITVQQIIEFTGLSEENVIALYTWSHITDFLECDSSSIQNISAKIIKISSIYAEPNRFGEQVICLSNRLLEILSDSPITLCRNFVRYWWDIYDHVKFKADNTMKNERYFPNNEISKEIHDNGLEVISSYDAAELHLYMFCNTIKWGLKESVRKDVDDKIEQLSGSRHKEK